MYQLEVNSIHKGIKTIIIAIMLVIVSFSFIANANEKSIENVIKLDYKFDIPSINTIDIEGTIYDRITLTYCYTAGNTGEPNVPSKGVYILLPPKSDVDEINVISKNKNKIYLTNEIDPISKPIPISNINKLVIPKKNKEVYHKNEIYPGKLHSYVGVHSFRGFNILVLLLHPVQYNPVTKELYYSENLEVNVKTKPNSNIGLYRGFENDNSEIIKKVDNPEIVNLYKNEMKTNPSSRDDYDLLILTTDSLKSGFESLKNAHNTKGVQTVIKTLNDVGSNDPYDVREYIKDAYFNMGVDYVLLGGDYDVFPTRILWVYGLDEETTPYDTYMPSDLYYSCLDGPYNYDGDDKWGEPEDGEDGGDVDLVADVYVGRACVDDSTDVSNFVTKTVAYINKDPEDQYLKNACFLGEYMGDHGIATWGGNYMDQLIDECTDDGYTTNGVPSDNFTITTLYDRDWEGHDWPKSELMNEIDDGVHFINHLGHSYYEYNMKMYYEDVYALSNTDYCFIYSQGCMAGGFDCDYVDCIAEHFTVKTDTGAFAGIWNARYGWFWSHSTDGDSQRFQREYWDAVFGEEIPQIGRANSDSKEDNLPIIGRSCIRWCYYQTNLFGDPSLEFYEKEENQPPSIPQINGPKTGTVGIEYTFEFTLTDPDDDYLYIMVDWDDVTPVDWEGPYGPGNIVTLKHTWNEEGPFQIKAKLKDLAGEESDWGVHDILIPKNKAKYLFLYKTLERFQLIQKVFLVK